jgi:hypothetical protein
MDFGGYATVCRRRDQWIYFDASSIEYGSQQQAAQKKCPAITVSTQIISVRLDVAEDQLSACTNSQ